MGIKANSAAGRAVLAALGEKVPRAGRKAPQVLTNAPPGWFVALELPCRVVSEANQRTHWAARRKRSKDQGDMLWLALLAGGFVTTDRRWRPPLPALVTFLHRGPRMDDDNLAGAFKGLRDAVADYLGVDDGSPAVRWVYEQCPGGPGVRVEIRPAGTGTAAGPGGG